jgi:hypothetical protein
MIGMHLISWLSFGLLGACLMLWRADYRASQAEAMVEELANAISVDTFDNHVSSALSVAHNEEGDMQ